MNNPHLMGRTATCGFPPHAERPSSPDLPFFEYCGPGSKEATDVCVCGFYRIAHQERAQHLVCKAFRARGPQKHDRYYCGCRGWD